MYIAKPRHTESIPYIKKGMWYARRTALLRAPVRMPSKTFDIFRSQIARNAPRLGIFNGYSKDQRTTVEKIGRRDTPAGVCKETLTDSNPTQSIDNTSSSLVSASAYACGSIHPCRQLRRVGL